MANDKIRLELNDRPGQAMPEQVEQQTQQSQASAAPQSERRVTPGRTPLFRR